MPLASLPAPMPVSSEAPVSTDVDTLEDVPLVREGEGDVGVDGDPSHSVPTTRWIGRRIIVAAAVFAAAVVLAVAAPRSSSRPAAAAEGAADRAPPAAVKLPVASPAKAAPAPGDAGLAVPR